MKFDGSCPFLTCLETPPHEHTACVRCGALRHGNAFCSECRSHWQGGDPWSKLKDNKMEGA